ncbi:uncharacterized protein [Palaemon carinicauda]|uniref:uncharacterized protein n=1 Tax=Palaemon carinicauda TaxID=392227 RepID=UPI0035B5D465
MFLDDGFGCAHNVSECEQLANQIKSDLLMSGFIPNAKKSEWIPVQVLEYLGVLLNSLEGTMLIPDRRICKALDTISGIFHAIKIHRRVPVRKLASIVGQIISMSLVLGHLSQIMTRYISLDILSVAHWDAYVPVSEDSIEQLRFWQSHLKLVNIVDLFEQVKWSRIVFSDASHSGYAGYEVNTINGVSHGQWTAVEAVQSSTWRELVAVLRVLQSLSKVLASHRVKWFSDNQAVTSIVKKGSMKKHLQDIAIEIFRVCTRNSIMLELEWVPRSENDKADYLSRIVDNDDWGISVELFQLLQSRFGQLQIDWFASEHNAKLPRFYSRFWNQSSTGIDAFTESWHYEFGLFVPPISMVYRVICKMEVDRARGVLVLPYWNSAAHKVDIEALPEVLAGKVDLLPDLLQKSRAVSTSRKYENSFIRWNKWALNSGLGREDILPAKAFTVAIYLCSLIQCASSPASVISAFYAIKWFHEMYDFKSPTDSQLVCNVLEAGKRILSKPVVKKEPVTVGILLKVYNGIYEDYNLKSQRIICACLLAFAGFMRSSELLNIKVSDIMIYKTYMSIFVETSKTDKYRDGAWITLARTGTCLCPVDNSKKLIEWAKLKPSDFLFCNLCKTQNGYTVRQCNKQMSYTNLRNEFLRALAPHVSDIKKYCLHSLRSGGASCAANRGVKDRLFKRHGRWLSDSAKDGYVKDSLQERLSVSLTLGL